MAMEERDGIHFDHEWFLRQADQTLYYQMAHRGLDREERVGIAGRLFFKQRGRCAVTGQPLVGVPRRNMTNPIAIEPIDPESPTGPVWREDNLRWVTRDSLRAAPPKLIMQFNNHAAMREFMLDYALSQGWTPPAEIPVDE